MSSPDQFTLTLKNGKTGSYQKLGIIFTALILVSFIFFIFFKETIYAGMTGVMVAVVYFIIRNLQRRRNPSLMLLDEKIFFLFAAVWLWLNIIVAVLILITAIFFSLALQKFTYHFDRDGISKDFFPRKLYPWSDIDSVILKGYLLTINFKNDHLIQGQVENPLAFNEADFNEYIEKQLSQS